MKRLAAILGLMSSSCFLFLVFVTASQAWISETHYNNLIQKYHDAGMVGQVLLWLFIIIPAVLNLSCAILSITTYRQNVFSYRTARNFQALFLRVAGIISPIFILFFFFFKMGPGTNGVMWDYQYVQNLTSTLPFYLSLLLLLFLVLFYCSGQIWNLFIDGGMAVSIVSQRFLLRVVYGVSASVGLFFVALAIKLSLSLLSRA